MNNESTSLLSQYPLDYQESTDYTHMNDLFGVWKRVDSAIKVHEFTLPLVTSSMRRIFKTK